MGVSKSLAIENAAAAQRHAARVAAERAQQHRMRRDTTRHRRRLQRVGQASRPAVRTPFWIALALSLAALIVF